LISSAKIYAFVDKSIVVIHRKSVHLLISDVFFEWRLPTFKWAYMYICKLCTKNKFDAW